MKTKPRASQYFNPFFLKKNLKMNEIFIFIFEMKVNDKVPGAKSKLLLSCTMPTTIILPNHSQRRFSVIGETTKSMMHVVSV